MGTSYLAHSSFSASQAEIAMLPLLPSLPWNGGRISKIPNRLEKEQLPNLVLALQHITTKKGLKNRIVNTVVTSTYRLICTPHPSPQAVQVGLDLPLALQPHGIRQSRWTHVRQVSARAPRWFDLDHVALLDIRRNKHLIIECQVECNIVIIDLSQVLSQMLSTSFNIG